MVVHTGHGEADAWAQCFSVADLDRLTNAARLPVVISAGCSTAYFAPLPPYGAYVDVEGKEHAGTDDQEVFRAPPPPPAPYQRGRFNPTGLGEQILKRGPNGAVAYIGCNTGSQPCGLTLVEGFVTALAEAKEPRLGDCWASAIRHYFDQPGSGSWRGRRVAPRVARAKRAGVGFSGGALLLLQRRPHPGLRGGPAQGHGRRESAETTVGFVLAGRCETASRRGRAAGRLVRRDASRLPTAARVV